MKHINNFDEFNESKLTPWIVGAGLAGAALWGADNIINPNTKTKVEYNDTNRAHFPEFSLTTVGSDNNLDVSINEVDTVIGTTYKCGKHTRYSITVDEGTHIVYYTESNWGAYVYATGDKSILPNSEKINLDELNVIEDCAEYKILEVGGVWSRLDHILVNKGYQNTKNEFEINGQKYTYFEKYLGAFEGGTSFVVKCKK